MGFLTTTWGAWLLIVGAGVNSCIGNLLLKQSRLVAPNAGWISLMTSPWFIASLICYGLNVVLFAKALDRLPVSVGYPALAGSGFVLLTVAAAWCYGEHLSLHQYAGLSVVLVGIVLLAHS